MASLWVRLNAAWNNVVTGTGTNGKLAKWIGAYTQGDATNTDTEVADAVTKKHTQLCEAADFSKLDGIEAGADVTDATNVAAAGAVMEGDTTTAAMSFVIDEDNMASNLATKVPTQQSVKAYADALIAANDAMVFKGVIDCSGNPNYPAADCGHVYKISVAGKLGGASGIDVEVGDTAICTVDSSASGTQAAVGANWVIIQTNIEDLDSVIDGIVATHTAIADAHHPPGGMMMIAAADSPSVLKLKADYVCDGTITTGGDESEINTALGVSNTVVLCPGTYYVGDSITMASNQTLIGGGNGTTIKLKNSKNATFKMIVNSDPSGGNSDIHIANLTLDGNQAGQASGDQYGIYFTKVAPAATSVGVTISNCKIQNFRQDAIWALSSYNIMVTGCKLWGCLDYGINFDTCFNAIISNNNFRGNYLAVWFDECDGNTLSNNVSEANTENNIYLNLSDNNTISGNVGLEIGGSGSGLILNTSHKNSVTSNTFCGYDGSGIYLLSSNNNTIFGNVCNSNEYYGIDLDACKYNTISGNTCNENYYDGICLSGSSHNGVTNNVCVANCQTGSGHADILIEANSDYNNIQNNLCRAGTLVNKPFAGICITGATSQYNFVANNDVYDDGFTSSPIYDDASNTRYAPGNRDVDAAIMTSLLTERGSIIYRNATVPAELLHGTDGQVLTTKGDGADPEWATPAGGGGTVSRAMAYMIAQGG